MTNEKCEDQAQEYTFYIEGLSCATCVAKVEKALSSVEGVEEARVNLVNEIAFVRASRVLDIPQLLSRVRQSGYRAVHKKIHTAREYSRYREKALFSLRARVIWGAVLSLGVFLVSMLSRDVLESLCDEGSFWFLVGERILSVQNEVLLVLSFPVQIIIGWSFIYNAYAELKKMRAAMDSLVTVGTLSAFVYSVAVTFQLVEGNVEYATSAMVITVVLFGRYLESLAKARTNTSVHGLLALRPKTACVLHEGEEKDTPIEDVEVGDVLAVRPGEYIPLDGVVRSGESYVNQAMITGEPKAVRVTQGSGVIGGTLNQNGYLQVEVCKKLENSMLAQMIALMEKAQSSKASIQRLADRIAGVFVPVVLVIACGTFVSWFFVFSQDGSSALADALMHTIAVLVIACPCAMGLATPTAIVVSIGKAAGLGILVKRVEALESLYRVRTVIFDKTGTLTTGAPSLVNIQVLDESVDERFVLQWAASAEQQSHHPLAKAILTKAQDMKMQLCTPSFFANFDGEGIEAHFENDVLFLGNARFIQSRLALVTLPTSPVNDLYTLCYLALNQKLIAVFAIGDSLRPQAHEGIALLKAKGFRTVIVSGDDAGVTERIGRELGVDESFGSLLPHEKMQRVLAFQEDGEKVLMIGDGINDAPALSQADVSVAIASGTDIAIDAADVILLKDDLCVLPRLLKLGSITIRTIRYNLFWAFVYNTLALPLAAGGLLTPIIAASATVLSSLCVVGNSVLLKSRSV